MAHQPHLRFIQNRFGHRLVKPTLGPVRPTHIFSGYDRKPSPATASARSKSPADIVFRAAHVLGQPEVSLVQIGSRFASPPPLIASLSTAPVEGSRFAAPSRARVDNPAAQRPRQALLAIATRALRTGLGDEFAEKDIEFSIREEWGNGQLQILRTLDYAFPDHMLARFLQSWSVEDVYHFTGMDTEALWSTINAQVWNPLHKALRTHHSARDFITTVAQRSSNIESLLLHLSAAANCSWPASGATIATNRKVVAAMLERRVPDVPWDKQLAAWKQATQHKTSDRTIEQSIAALNLIAGFEALLATRNPTLATVLERATRVRAPQFFGTAQRGMLPLLEHLSFFREQLDLTAQPSAIHLRQLLDRTRNWQTIEQIRRGRATPQHTGSRYVLVPWVSLITRGNALGISTVNLDAQIKPHVAWASDFAIERDSTNQHIIVVARRAGVQHTYRFTYHQKVGRDPNPRKNQYSTVVDDLFSVTPPRDS